MYDLNGKKFADFERRETITIDEEKRHIRYYCGENRLFSSDGEYVYDGNEIKSEKRIGRIEKRSFLALAAILIGVIIGLSGLFTVYAVLTHRPGPAPEPITLTIEDKNGEWGAEGEINLFNGMVLKPGVNGEYWFKIANPNPVYLEYDIILNFVYENGKLEVPMKWTLKMNNVTVPFDKNEEGICSASDMIFAANSVQLFMLCFDWPFEQGTDQQDTAVGIDAGNCKCPIKVSCQEYDPEV